MSVLLKRHLKSLLLVALALVATAGSAAAENYAFLVAVGNYEVKDLKPLKFARSDILEFKQVLLESGFDEANVLVMHDDSSHPVDGRYIPEADKIRKELALSMGKLKAGDTFIVAFSGHGVQFQGEQKSYFCPADADLGGQERKQLVSFADLCEQLEKCPAQHKLLLVDASRNDPRSDVPRSRDSVQPESVTRPQANGASDGTVAFFSCAAGQLSFDSPDLKHSVFFHHVLEAWKGRADDGDKELTLDELVAYARRGTLMTARMHLRAIQTPDLKGTYSGTWVLRKLGE
jgi:uncharacterized caspase-like protein